MYKGGGVRQFARCRLSKIRQKGIGERITGSNGYFSSIRQECCPGFCFEAKRELGEPARSTKEIQWGNGVVEDRNGNPGRCRPPAPGAPMAGMTSCRPTGLSQPSCCAAVSLIRYALVSAGNSEEKASSPGYLHLVRIQECFVDHQATHRGLLSFRHTTAS